jgi:hypothetical protein
MLFASLAFSHNGLLGLFTDETAIDNDFEPIQFVPFDVHVIYIRSNGGPDGITAFEFKLEKNNANIIVAGATWKQGFIYLGDVESGISVATGGCYGSGQEYALLGYITIFSIEFSMPWTTYLKIAADPGAQSPGIWVSTCEEGYPLHAVLGGYFYLHEFDAVDPTSWGAIKSMISE